MVIYREYIAIPSVACIVSKSTAKRPGRYNQDVLRRTRANRAVKRAYVARLMKLGHCVHCGEDDHRCLTFYRPDGERMDPAYKYGLGTLTSRAVSWERLQAAIDKCVLVCFNDKARLEHNDA